jgi:peptide/nickel transport system substrate-binding protein
MMVFGCVTGRRKRSALIVLVGSLLMAGAASAQTLRTVINADIRGLMPGRSPDISTGSVLQNVYEGLVAWRSDGSVAPMLAEKIDVSPDSRTYTFTMRDGVTFHNGAPLTAKEVVWTWERFLDPKSAWPCRGNFDGSNAIKIEKVEALDEKHVAFHLASPSGALLSAMARADCDSTGIAHPASVDADGNWATAIGTGPFRLSEWRKGQFVELARFDGYKPRSEAPDGLTGAKIAKVEKIRFELIPDAQATKLALFQGKIDIWPEADSNQIKELQQNPAVTVLTTPLAAIYALPFQTRDPVLADKRIRQAINYAIDRQSLSGALYDVKVPASASLIPATSSFYGPVQKTGAEFDPAKAKALLTAAGYKGERIVILTNKQNAVMADTAIYVQAMLREVGLNVDVEVMEFGAQFERYYAGRYQMMVWNVTPYLDPLFIVERFTGDKARQADKPWDDPKARDLLRSLFAERDVARRQALYDDLQRLYLDDMPMVVWGTRVSFSAVRKNVVGFEGWPGQKPRFWNVSVN